VSIERSLELVVALLGILKAGGAYVPLDPSFGKGRIQYVLDEARVRVLITQESLRNSLPPTSADIVCLDSSWTALSGQSDQPVAAEVSPSNLAYVIYTSGSTGKPKGVQLEHRSVVNFLCSMRREPGLDSHDALVAVTTISFDIAGLEIFLPLMVGARLVVASREATFDGNRLKDLLKNSRATVMQATPTTWRLLFECGWQGDSNLKALVGGEALPPELARRLAACGSVWNMYGPTETTIWSSSYRVDGRDERNVPIGKPIANTSLYILDVNQQPLPPGSEGELYIGGEGLARGYFERPQLTDEKFVPDPFPHLSGARMYRTGDLARRRPDGNVEFLGRLDHQVKIRGFRIELGEVEAVLEQHPAVQQAVAVARNGEHGDKYLAAYLVAHPESRFAVSELRNHLKQQLPEYMVPSAFVTMREFPLTPNGKVDRKALPAPQSSDYQQERTYVAPRDRIEKRLVALWEDVLNVRPIGVKDGFFDLGGRSLLAARLFIKIAHKFGRELPLTTLIHAPTVELLANELRPTAKNFNYPTLVPMKTGGRPPFFCVHGGAGSTLFMHRLAEKMDADHPFYGIEPEGLNGKRFQRTTIEQMAAHYLSEIRKIQPTGGPYYIGGYCFGGVVAFEMAQQLRRAGNGAALVTLFTAPLRYHRLVPAPRSVPAAAKSASQKLATLMRSPARALYRKSARLVTKTRQKLAPTAYKVWFRLGLRIPPSMRTLYVWRTLLRAEQNYVPKPYAGTLVLFHGSDYASDPNLGWDRLADCLEHRIIGEGAQGSRRDLMDEPLVDQTARELSACINGASAPSGFPSTSVTATFPATRSA